MNRFRKNFLKCDNTRPDSTLHWDMVCDLRKGGKAYVDGKVFLKDGESVAGV